VASPNPVPAPVATSGEGSTRVQLPAGILSGMLLFAKVTKQDVLYHPECGDGRLLNSAAARFQCAGVGFESDAALVQQAQENIRKARLKSLVSVEQTDFMAGDYSRATVVFLTMSAVQHQDLLGAPRRQLRAGTRLVALTHPLEGWRPLAESTVRDEHGNPHQLFVWLVEDERNKSISSMTSWEWER
jgi:precorrin-6B methylase 2